MKKICFIFSLLVSIIIFAGPAREWDWKLEGDRLTISLSLTEGLFCHEKETIVRAGQLLPILIPKTSIRDNEPILTGNCYWVFNIRKAEFPLKITLRCQICSVDGNCFFPEETTFSLVRKKDRNGTRLLSVKKKAEIAVFPAFKEIRRSGGYRNASDFLAFLRGTEKKSLFDFTGKSFWLVLLLTLLGGIALNLTPCILPMIPVTLAVIGASSARGDSRKSAFVRGSVYALGMMLSYGTLGLLAVFGGTMFGTFVSAWWFNCGICLLFILLGLSMFDVVLIDFSRFRTRFGHPDNTRLFGVFLLGVIFAFFAGACVAPVVLAVLLYTAKLSAWYAVVFPFMLGLGMGLPWPLIGAGLASLPKPGKWMTYVKYVFGIFIIVLGVYYGWSGIRLLMPPAHSVRGAGISQISAAIKDSAKPGAKPVLLDFRADWCKNCLAMEQTVLRDRSVRKELAKFTVLTVDATDLKSTEIQKILKSFSVDGLPVYLIIRGK